MTSHVHSWRHFATQAFYSDLCAVYTDRTSIRVLLTSVAAVLCRRQREDSALYCNKGPLSLTDLDLSVFILKRAYVNNDAEENSDVSCSSAQTTK